MGHHWGHRRRWAPIRNGLANFGFHYAYDGADRTLASRASGDADAAAMAMSRTPSPAVHGDAAGGCQPAARSGPVAALGALVRNGLSRLLAVDF